MNYIILLEKIIEWKNQGPTENKYICAAIQFSGQNKFCYILCTIFSAKSKINLKRL